MSHLPELILPDGEQVIESSFLSFHGGALELVLLPLPQKGRFLLLRLTSQVLDVQTQLVLKRDVLSDVLLQLLYHFLVHGRDLLIV
jgi:hypothetical protein